MPSRKVLLSLAATAALVAVAWIAVDLWSGKAGKAGEGALQPDDAALLASGQQVYQAHCAACHGAKLEGQPQWRERGPTGLLPAPPHDESGHTWHHPDAVLFRITKFGVARAANLKDYTSAMPSYEGVLSDKEIVAVLSWIKAQWPAPIRHKHDLINAQARPAAAP